MGYNNTALTEHKRQLKADGICTDCADAPVMVMSNKSRRVVRCEPCLLQYREKHPHLRQTQRTKQKIAAIKYEADEQPSFTETRAYKRMCKVILGAITTKTQLSDIRLALSEHLADETFEKHFNTRIHSYIESLIGQGVIFRDFGYRDSWSLCTTVQPQHLRWCNTEIHYAMKDTRGSLGR